MSEANPHILVTGSTGFLGSRLVEILVNRGYRVRALARKTSNIERLKSLDVEISYGDVTDQGSLGPAFMDIDVVIHAAADTRGDQKESLQTTITGTKNIAFLSKQHDVNRLIYISSCSVYGISELQTNQIVDEDASLEKYPEKRGVYSESKSIAEKCLLDTAQTENIPFVCLRPGTIFGEGGTIFTPMMGFALKNKLFTIIGDGTFVMPFVYIDNLVEAIILSIDKDNSKGQIYNVIDSEQVTKKEYVDLLLRKLYRDAKFLYIPYGLFYAFIYLQEIIITQILRRKPFLTRYRLISSQKNIIYDSSKIKRELNWRPATTLRDAMGKVLLYETNKSVKTQTA